MSAERPPLPEESLVVRQGYLRRLKTMKRKYFVLKSESRQNSARLEYYDSEKKFRTRGLPKRAIPLKTCFNINRRLDTKHKHVIALYTKEEGFCMVLDNEEELRAWLNALLALHHGDEQSDELQYPKQHVWTVNIQKKGLGASKNILGLYNLCLTEKTISLTKIKANNNVTYDPCIPEQLEFALRHIRRCGNSECFFYLEAGRQTVTGAGELWMHTEDSNIAQSMHTTILRAMKNCNDSNDLQPKYRDRSMSASDATKPLSAYNRRQTMDGRTGTVSSTHDITAVVRNRCDSMPSRVCQKSDENEKTLSRVPSQHLDNLGESGDDSVDGATEWTPSAHLTPRIPEEPDQTVYCEMNPPPAQRLPMKSSSTHHSRNSSIAENASPTEGYLSMMPAGFPRPGDTGYVDMHAGRASSPAASGSSVASGTPSTDLRFSEYHLDPISAKILLEEDERPIPRAYSVGSRPTPAPQARPLPEMSRTRAFSVGSRTKMRPIGHAPPPTLIPFPSAGNKTSSAPLLAPRSSADTLCDDLMELDFSNNQSPRTKPPSYAHAARTPPTGFAVPVYASTPRPAAPKVDEYVDMSPSTPRAMGYVEMKPTERGLTPTSTETLMGRSPPARAPPIAATPGAPDGYVEMNYGKRIDSTRIPSRPILILSDPNRPVALSTRPPTLDSERSTPSRTTPLLSPQSVGKNIAMGSSRNVKKSTERQRRNSKDSGTPTGAQSLFSMSLESPASPSNPLEREKEAEADDLFADCSHYADMVGTTLSTVREINEECVQRTKSQEMAETPPDYVVLKPSSEAARPVSQPIATRGKLDSDSEGVLSSNPTATKTLTRESSATATARADEVRPALVRAATGSCVRFTPVSRAEVSEPPPRKSSSPKPVESALNRALRGDTSTPPPLNYAALDLEPPTGAPPSPTPVTRPYTQIDFARSEKLNTVDTN